MRLMTILGTRPDLIKMSRVLPVLDQHFEHVFVHTGQNYDFELHGVFFQELGIRKPDCFMGAAGKNPAETVANIIKKADELYEKFKPDAVLFYGDTNSVMAVYPAKRRKIPIFHMEAGNRSFNPLVPEETNRKIIDHLADVNMVNSEHARKYLLAEGLPPDRVIKTGSPMLEVLTFYIWDIKRSLILQKLELQPGDYFVASMHREANVDDPQQLQNWMNALSKTAEHYKSPMIFSCHPRTWKRLQESRFGISSLIQVMKPMGLADYCWLQCNAKCTISDSGTITEEASILGFPAVTIRKAHERPEGMDEGVVAMCGEPENLIDAVTFKTQQYSDQKPGIVPDYDIPQISYKVANIILSYADFVNRVVWKKH